MNIQIPDGLASDFNAICTKYNTSKEKVVSGFIAEYIEDMRDYDEYLQRKASGVEEFTSLEEIAAKYGLENDIHKKS